MKTSSLTKYASRALGGCALAAMLTSCGGSGPSGSNVQTLASLPASTESSHPDRSHSRMASDAKSMNLFYISDAESGDLYVYSYPGAKLKGTITGLNGPEGECSDKAGDVFVANTGATEVLEYAHGGMSPIATLNDSGYYPLGCSVDPTTGNLAVTNACAELYGQCVADGNVLVYADAKGKPKAYSDSSIAEYSFCGYDDQGNLYVDGLNNSNFAFAELRRSHSSFTDITLNQTIYQPGGVQWDGKYVAIGNEDLYNNIVLEFAIKGTQGTLARAGGTPLDGGKLVVQFWIQGNVIIGPNHGGSGSVMFWRFPAGGSPTKTLDAFSTPIGSTVSLATP
jgi:DNA-binding beta-propeller fold protein YncE